MGLVGGRTAVAGNMSKASNVVTEELRSLVAARLKSLAGLSDAELRKLPATVIEKAGDPPSKVAQYTVAQYHDLLKNGEQMFVVQAGREGILGLTAIEVDGFVLGPDGSRRPLSEKETWNFS